MKIEAKDLTSTRYVKKTYSSMEVGNSDDLRRIKNLPRRKHPTEEESNKMIELITDRLRLDRNETCSCQKIRPTKDGSSACLKRLRKAQAWALLELYTVGGILGSIGVGHGKTLLGILSPMMLKDCKIALLLCPPGLVDQIILEYSLAYEHFDVPSLVIHGKTWSRIIKGKPVLHVLPYSRLSRSNASAFIRRLDPDFIISDEVHKLKDSGTATTSRVLRFFQETNMETRFAGWTGTLTDKSIKDFAHLSAMSLKMGSPLPLDKDTLSVWAGAVDPSPIPDPPGALEQFCKPGQTVKEGFRDRLIETPGFIATRSPAIDAKVVITQRKSPEVPTIVKEALESARNGVRPDGEELVDALEIAKSCAEIASGFYYRWTFPRGEKISLIEEWLAARKDWNRELRDKLKPRKEFLDSPHLCELAAMRYFDGLDSEGPVWKAHSWPRWREIKKAVQPVTVPVRLDPFLANDTADWAHKNRGIVWYGHNALGEWIAEISGLAKHGGGPDAPARIAKEDGKKSIIVSIDSHGTGRDGLQRLYNKQLVAARVTSGKKWEQLLGRLHRIGQNEKKVFTEIYRHTEEFSRSLDTATGRTNYAVDLLGSDRKLSKGLK